MDELLCTMKGLMIHTEGTFMEIAEGAELFRRVELFDLFGLFG